MPIHSFVAAFAFTVSILGILAAIIEAKTALEQTDTFQFWFGLGFTVLTIYITILCFLMGIMETIMAIRSL